MQTVTCPYCDKPAPLVMGEELYPHRPDLWSKRFYWCRDCDARVGCHPGTSKPLGVLAGPIIRRARMDAHKAFDPLWKSGRFRNRKAAYRWLAGKLGMIGATSCHIGCFDKQQCEDTIAACQGKREPESEADNDTQNS